MGEKRQRIKSSNHGYLGGGVWGVFLFACFVLFWLRWVFVAVRGLFLVKASRGYSLLQCAGFSLQWLLLLQSMGSRHVGSVVVVRGP